MASSRASPANLACVQKGDQDFKSLLYVAYLILRAYSTYNILCVICSYFLQFQTYSQVKRNICMNMIVLYDVLMILL